MANPMRPLAQALGTDASAATRVVDRLERNILVRLSAVVDARRVGEEA